jgi:3-oxoadipate enol-lactonase
MLYVHLHGVEPPTYPGGNQGDGTFAMNFIEVNGTGLRYERTGSGPSTLVLVHEMGGSLDSWDQVLPALVNSRQVLRYDTRGAGMSEKIKGSVTWDTMADDLGALLDALGITGKVSLAGIAVGGAICMHFAARHPDRVAALVMHGPAPGVTADRRQATLDRAASVESGGMRSVVETSLAASYPPVVRHLPEVFAAFRARWLGNDPESFAAINRMLAAENIEHELGSLRCPTLLTAGRHDSLRPPSVIAPMAEKVPGAQFLELNSGHFAAVQTPGLVAQALHYFLHALGQ